ncbi:DUF4433 domain-containing protein, partial [bacterium]|nr:DUF4433 domain-containing protein [bacterium]
MSIPDKFKHRSVYHFTHIDNLPTILEHGLLSTNEMERRRLGHNVIAYSRIQDCRSDMDVTCGMKGKVHNYVPLYFCIRSPMLYAVMYYKIADEKCIIYLEFPISIMDRYPFVFTDASANTWVPPNFYADPKNLKTIDWDAVETWKWGKQHDKEGQTPIKQAKMAELLIHEKLDLSDIAKIIVWNSYIADIVKKVYKENNLNTPPITYGGTEYYYLDNKLPPVTGPLCINREYEETIDFVLQNIGKASKPKFKKLKDLRSALRVNLGCIPETAEIVDLESDNEMHSEDVGTHTLKVVEELRKLSVFKDMNSTDKLFVEIAAYLHDIGKGPKSRWASNEGKQKVDPDHPIKALPMLKRILIEDIAKMKPRSAKVICKLVCYHDIVGDIVAKGRRVEELEEIVE